MPKISAGQATRTKLVAYYFVVNVPEMYSTWYTDKYLSTILKSVYARIKAKKSVLEGFDGAVPLPLHEFRWHLDTVFLFCLHSMTLLEYKLLIKRPLPT